MKRTIAWFLAVVLAFALFPIGALAAGTSASPASTAEPEADDAPESSPAPAAEEVQQGDFYGFTIALGGKEFTLPMTYADFVAAGWKPDPSRSTKLDEMELDANTCYSNTFQMTDGMSWVGISLMNATDKKIKGADADIYRFEIKTEDCDDFDYAGFTAKTTAKELFAAVGYPPNDYDRSETFEYTWRASLSGSTLVAVSTKNDREISFVYDKATNKMTEFVLDNSSPIAPYAPGEIGKAYAAGYEAPTELVNKAIIPIVELGGDLYRFPCPQSAFIDNGWTLLGYGNVFMSFGCAVFVRGYDRVVVDLFNQADGKISVADAAVSGINASTSDPILYGLKFCGDFKLGMTDKEFVALFPEAKLTDNTETYPNQCTYIDLNGESRLFYVYKLSSSKTTQGTEITGYFDKETNVLVFAVIGCEK